MITFRLFAGTNIGLRDNNEDNFTVNRDLSQNEWVVPSNQKETIQLGTQGCLAVIADGMGGQNAGEIASATAIETVQELFSPTSMPSNVVEKPERIISYIKKVIIQADLRIKQRGTNDSSVQGMGSTIVIVWLIGGNAYVGWMGDSRAYSYMPDKGLSRITKDHSFVQQLVDANIMSEEQAMNDPNSNIVTRSLGDASQKAKPDVICHSVTQGELLLLCTDGLCGVCNDKEIEIVLNQESNDIYSCKEKLTESALSAGGSDNITIALLQIVELDNDDNGVSETKHNEVLIFLKKHLSIKKFLSFLLVVILVLTSYFVGVYKSRQDFIKTDVVTDSDSLAVEKQDTIEEVDRPVVQKQVNILEKAVEKIGKDVVVKENRTISEGQTEDTVKATPSFENKNATTEIHE